MTTLRDKIRDVVIDYIEDTENGEPQDEKVLVDSIMEEISGFFINVIDN